MKTVTVDALTGEVVERTLTPDEIEAIRLNRVSRLTETDYSNAIERHLEYTAQSRGYKDSTRLTTYTASKNPAWKAEADAFVDWRDAVWAFAYTLMAEVLAGTQPKPTIDELIAALPPMVWPEAS